MATSALLSVLIFGISLALKCEFSSAHAQGETKSRSNAAVIIYEMMADLYELKYENKMIVEKIEMLEGISAKGKVMAEKIEDLEEKLNSAEGIILDRAKKIETLEEKTESLETSAEERIMGQGEKIEMLEEKLESQETSMMDQAKTIDMFKDNLESQKASALGQREKIETIKENLESQKTSTTGQAEKIEMLEEKLESLESSTEGVKSAFTVKSPVEGLLTNTLRFTSAITNVGGHYDTSTGLFTCEYPGIYVFTLNGLTKKKKWPCQL